MARPKKNNCDYFSHDANMRNHKKVKAIRGKYPNGYAIWSMLLEYLTDSEGNEFENTELEYELIAGDFGFDVDEIKGVVDYAIMLGMLFEKDGFVYSKTLDKRLSPVYEKRGRLKELSEQQHRINGRFCDRNSEKGANTGISVTETPQTKLNKTKGNKTIRLGTNVPVKTKVLTDDKELKKSFEKVDVKDLGQVTTFIRAHKPHFTEPYTALWNLFAVKHGFAQVSKITDKRRKKIRTRMKDADFDMLAILAKAKDSEMLHEGSWFTFDFIIENSDNYVKIMEGKYSKSLNSKPATTTDPELSEATKQMLQRKNQSV